MLVDTVMLDPIIVENTVALVVRVDTVTEDAIRLDPNNVEN